MPSDSSLRALWRYLWRLDRQTRDLLRMDPAAMLAEVPWASEKERELAAQLRGHDGRSNDGSRSDTTSSGGSDPEGNGSDGGAPGRRGGGGTGGGSDDDDDDDDENDGNKSGAEAALARTAEGSSFDVDDEYGRRNKIGFVVGPLLFAAILLAPNPEGLPVAGQAVAASTAWIATWWISEAIPIPITSLLPLVLFPVTGALEPGPTAQPYASPIIFLFMGGFLLAVTIQRWGLHRRIALRTIKVIGTSPTRIILGFMIATAFLSMWVSNTATVVMMTPIGLAVIVQIRDLVAERDPTISVTQGEFYFGTGLMLCIAYSASVGGVGTLIGTPPNIVFAGVVEEQFGQGISFFQWMLYGVPIAVLGVAIVWVYITQFLLPPQMSSIPGGLDVIDDELKSLGAMSREETLVSIVFVATALAWISREFVINEFLPTVGDSTIAIAAAIILAMIPARDADGSFTFLLDWTTGLNIPWGIILLFGGGLSIAAAFGSTGLAEWIGLQLSALDGMSLLVVISVVVILTVFLTEVTSNTATTAMLMPILASLAIGLSIHPYGIMIAGATAASFAFMLPVATPPNAVVFGSGYITMPQMVRAGIGLNLIGIVLIILLALTWLPFAWGIDVTALPEWAMS